MWFDFHDSMAMLNNFKKFILRGNVLDLAVGIMVGSAFTAVVNALVKDFMTPLVGAIVKIPDFSNLKFTLGGSQFLYGDLLNNVISFILIAATVYFLIVIPMNTFVERARGPTAPPEDEPPAKKQCPECKSEIPVAATRCAFCTTKLEA